MKSDMRTWRGLSDGRDIDASVFTVLWTRAAVFKLLDASGGEGRDEGRLVDCWLWITNEVNSHIGVCVCV
jgi:hypothetical protein